jgi:hypothetical protein
MAENFLPKCIGFVDGSDAVFYPAPTEDKEAYWSRKKKYCMQFQILCDPDKLIRNLFTGYPGSVHDAKVFTSSTPFLKSHQYFSSGEYIIGDSAYPKSETVVVPYKRTNGNLSRRQSTFNTHISGYRIAVEHTIGILKGRFQSLRGLRINVNKDSGHAKVCQWIQACSVLHNILTLKDPWTQETDYVHHEDDDLEDSISQDENLDASRTTGVLRQQALTEIVCSMYS